MKNRTLIFLSLSLFLVLPLFTSCDKGDDPPVQPGKPAILVAPLETLTTKFNPVFNAVSETFDGTFGYNFKVLDNNIQITALGCAPATDGEYTVTLYANDTEQILATAKVQAVGTSETKVKFFYTDLSNKINLEKDKTYTVGYFQPKNQKFFLIQNTILNDQKLIPGLTILSGVFTVGNSFPKTQSTFTLSAEIKYSKN